MNLCQAVEVLWFFIYMTIFNFCKFFGFVLEIKQISNNHTPLHKVPGKHITETRSSVAVDDNDHHCGAAFTPNLMLLQKQAGLCGDGACGGGGLM